MSKIRVIFAILILLVAAGGVAMWRGDLPGLNRLNGMFSTEKSERGTPDAAATTATLSQTTHARFKGEAQILEDLAASWDIKNLPAAPTLGAPAGQAQAQPQPANASRTP